MRLKEVKQLADSLRMVAAKMVNAAKSGHIGLPLGMADVAAVLWSEFLHFCPQDPTWLNRDRFVMSCGHGSALLYSILYFIGTLTYEDCMNFRKLGSKTPGHPEYDPHVGVEMTTGPLGQGIAWALGMARAEQIGELNYYTYVFCSDGDLMEGVAYEAISLAAEWKCKKLIVFWDDNQITIDGKLNKESHKSIMNLFSQWNFIQIDGHNYEEIYSAILKAKESDLPTCIRCSTIIGLGLDSAGTSVCHGYTPEIKDFINKMDIDLLATAELWQKIRKQNGLNLKDKSNLNEKKVEPLILNIENLKISTRKIAGKMLSNQMTGSADLGESTCMALSHDYTNFGVREHAMVAIAGGMLLSGMVIFVSTFLVFTDYCRPSIRLAALMKIPLKIIATHDSVFVGEDGPTHQPVEHLSSLRLIPNLHVWRPASIMEMSAAIQDDCASIIACTRQEIILFKNNDNDRERIKKGAYIVHYVKNPIATIIATGSEVQLALSIVKELNQPIQVVSAPCLELFDLQKEEYRKEILVGKVISIEAGRTSLWYKYADLAIGIDEFGTSAPMENIDFLCIDKMLKKIKDFFKYNNLNIS